MYISYSSTSGRFLPCAGLLAAFAVQGCAGGVSARDVAGYDNQLATGNYAGASTLATGAGGIGADGRSSNLLWSLNAGAATTYSGDGSRTILVLDEAEAMMKRRDLGTTAEKGQYHARTYDGVMVNAYKAISAMHDGHSDIARTELLRSEDRQSRAETDYQAEVAADRASGGGDSAELQGMLSSARSNAEYQAASRDMANYGAYKPFINPFATYLAGLYFLNTADDNKEKARNAFQRVRGVIGGSVLVDGDYALATQRTKFTPKTWVIFENGQGSTLVEYSLTFPVPFVGRHSGVGVATVAMPRLQENAAAAAGLLVGEHGDRTSVIGNFDYVMRSEFQRRYPAILSIAVAEAIAKIALQNAAAQEKTGLALLAAIVVSNISTADVRSWSALPKDFQVARIEAPKDGMVRLRTDTGAEFGSIKVPTDASSIVYVKALRPGSPPSIQVLRF